MQTSHLKANLSLQIVPINTTQAYPIIDAAIEAIQQSGIQYEVQPFSTVMEGELEELIDVVLKAKEAAWEAGGDELVLNIQFHLKKSKDVFLTEKTEKFR